METIDLFLFEMTSILSNIFIKNVFKNVRGRRTLVATTAIATTIRDEFATII